MEPSDFKMEDFMDVVYKCKFCPYSCTQSPDMGLHVKEKHLKPSIDGDPLQEKTTGVSQLPTGSFVYNVGNSAPLNIPEGSISSSADKNSNISIQVSDNVLAFTQAEGQAFMDNSLPRATPVTDSVSSLTLANEEGIGGATSELTELISIVKVNKTVGSDDSVVGGGGSNGSMIQDGHDHHNPQQSHSTLTLESVEEPLSSRHQQQQQQQQQHDEAGVVIVTSSSSSSSASSSSSSILPIPQPPSLPSGFNRTTSQAMSVMAIQLPAINSDGTSSQQYIMHTADSGMTLAMNDTTETKEFLLCGLCKLAFTSMEDCQSHMQAEHREMVQGLGVSIGVQVGGGKRGRKRKSEIQQQTSSEHQEITVKEEPDLDPDDLEWLPSVPEGNQTTHRDGRTRRKVIPPRALKEDYVLGRRVVKKRKRRNNSSLGYNVVCPMMNCKARFRTKESMEIHLSSHNLDDASFTCPECQASHDFWKHLRIHLWKVHKIDVDLLTCDKCDYKTDTSHKMSIHKEIHADAKPYKCMVCNKGFRQAAQQKNHMAIHRNASSRQDSGLWFASKSCDICERVFANSKCLAKHKEAVHAKLKPYQCSFCGHTTARKAMMELHVRTHTGEKPFKCDVCTYTTGDHNSMRRHKMRHTGEKMYQCSLCPYTCIQSISLKQHIKNKHPGVNSGIFQCHRCPFRSVNHNHFECHIMDHKKGLICDVPVPLKVNEAKPKKLVPKQLAGNVKQRGVTIHNGIESLFRKHPQFHTIIPGDSTTSGQTSLEGIALGTSAGDLSTDVFNMQVTMLAGGDTQVSAEDMTRLSENPNLLALGISPLQLIYATLSTISEQTDLSCVDEGRSSLLTIELVGGIQTSVLSSVQENAITHSITYHFPVISTTAETAVNGGSAISLLAPLTNSSSLTTSSFVVGDNNTASSFVVGDNMNKVGVVSVVDSSEGEGVGVGDVVGGSSSRGVGVGGIGGKIQSVMNIEGIEMIDSANGSATVNNKQHLSSMSPSSYSSSIIQLPTTSPPLTSSSSSLSLSSSNMLSNDNENIILTGNIESAAAANNNVSSKNYQKFGLLENAGSGSSISSSSAGGVSSSAFLASSLQPGFINLVGTSLKTAGQRQDLSLEVVDAEEVDRSVFLVQENEDNDGDDASDLVVESSANCANNNGDSSSSSSNNKALQHRNIIVGNEEERGENGVVKNDIDDDYRNESDTGNSYIVLGGRPMDLEEPVEGSGSANSGGSGINKKSIANTNNTHGMSIAYLKLPPEQNSNGINININGVNASSSSSSSSSASTVVICGNSINNNNNTAVSAGYNSLMSRSTGITTGIALDQTPQQYAMINSTTANPGASLDSGNFIQLIPINFLDHQQQQSNNSSGGSNSNSSSNVQEVVSNDIAIPTSSHQQTFIVTSN